MFARLAQQICRSSGGGGGGGGKKCYYQGGLVVVGSGTAAIGLLSSLSVDTNNNRHDYDPVSLTTGSKLYYDNKKCNVTFCDIGSADVEEQVSRQQQQQGVAAEEDSVGSKQAGMDPSEEGDFHGLFPRAQLWQPRVQYPLWDQNWDNQQLPSTGNASKDRAQMQHLRREGVTRHIILIRHGQYDESYKYDEKRKLTQIGRQQAEETGKRLAEIMKGAEQKFGGPCHIKFLHVSDLTRAKETADIIAKYLPDIQRTPPNPKLNEGRPCHNIPGGKASESVIKATQSSHERIEEGFRDLFLRATHHTNNDNQQDGNNSPKHEFEIVVGHANVIRYFTCRALQLPPEAWLRLCTFNCSLTYLTIRPTGTVSCRMLGDIGHLPYDLVTFSGHHGFNW